MNAIFLEKEGYCPACDNSTVFMADGPYFRNTLKCTKCQSLPRHRALMHVLTKHFPNWRNLKIHESSPGWDIISQRLTHECAHYIASHYDISVPFGTLVNTNKLPCKKYYSENLEAQTFTNEQFDLVITQDVFEHILNPDLAIAEIARTLKPGGATIMTVPIIRKTNPSQRRATLINGELNHIQPAQYHGNPIDGKGALVTIDWGYDIVSYFQNNSGLSFLLIQIENMELGIAGDLIDVLIGYKQSLLS